MLFLTLYTQVTFNKCSPRSPAAVLVAWHGQTLPCYFLVWPFCSSLSCWLSTHTFSLGSYHFSQLPWSSYIGVEVLISFAQRHTGSTQWRSGKPPSHLLYLLSVWERNLNILFQNCFSNLYHYPNKSPPVSQMSTPHWCIFEVLCLCPKWNIISQAQW